MRQFKKLLSDRRGEGSYIGVVVFVLAAAIFIAFIINLFAVISAKQQLDIAADQLTRQIQLSGEVNSDTDKLFDMICGKMKGLDGLTYSVDTTYLRGTKIQLGTPFQVTVSATGYLGGFGDFIKFPIHLISTAAGVSEEYWK